MNVLKAEMRGDLIPDEGSGEDAIVLTVDGLTTKIRDWTWGMTVQLWSWNALYWGLAKMA